MTELILIRHGETEWNRERRMQGQTDTPLSDIGRAQAAALGRRFAGADFAALYSSDLSRAHHTADAVAAVTGHEIRLDRALREREFGLFEGLTADEIAARYPEEYARFKARDPDWAVAGGESPRAFYARCMETLGRIARRHHGETVVVVTHGLVLDSAYRAAHRMPLDVQRAAPLLNASLNVFRCEAGEWTNVSWGDVSHLDGVAVTRYEGRSL